MTSTLRRSQGIVHDLPTGEPVYRIEQLFGVLSRGSCLQVLRSLTRGPRNVGELVVDTHWPYSRVSKDLAELRRAGLVQGHVNGLRHAYELTARVGVQQQDGHLSIQFATANGDVCIVRLLNVAMHAAMFLAFVHFVAPEGCIV